MGWGLRDCGRWWHSSADEEAGYGSAWASTQEPSAQEGLAAGPEAQAEIPDGTKDTRDSTAAARDEATPTASSPTETPDLEGQGTANKEGPVDNEIRRPDPFGGQEVKTEADKEDTIPLAPEQAVTPVQPAPSGPAVTHTPQRNTCTATTTSSSSSSGTSEDTSLESSSSDSSTEDDVTAPPPQSAGSVMQAQAPPNRIPPPPPPPPKRRKISDSLNDADVGVPRKIERASYPPRLPALAGPWMRTSSGNSACGRLSMMQAGRANSTGTAAANSRPDRHLCRATSCSGCSGLSELPHDLFNGLACGGVTSMVHLCPCRTASNAALHWFSAWGPPTALAPPSRKTLSRCKLGHVGPTMSGDRHPSVTESLSCLREVLCRKGPLPPAADVAPLFLTLDKAWEAAHGTGLSTPEFRHHLTSFIQVRECVAPSSFEGSCIQEAVASMARVRIGLLANQGPQYGVTEASQSAKLGESTEEEGTQRSPEEDRLSQSERLVALTMALESLEAQVRDGTNLSSLSASCNPCRVLLTQPAQVVTNSEPKWNAVFRSMASCLDGLLQRLMFIILYGPLPFLLQQPPTWCYMSPPVADTASPRYKSSTSALGYRCTGGRAGRRSHVSLVHGPRHHIRGRSPPNQAGTVYYCIPLNVSWHHDRSTGSSLQCGSCPSLNASHGHRDASLAVSLAQHYHHMPDSLALILQDSDRNGGHAVIPLPGGRVEHVTVTTTGCPRPHVLTSPLVPDLHSCLWMHDKGISVVRPQNASPAAMPSPSSRRRSAQRPGRRERQADAPQEPVAQPLIQVPPQVGNATSSGQELSALQLTQLMPSPGDMPIDFDGACGGTGGAVDARPMGERNQVVAYAADEASGTSDATSSRANAAMIAVAPDFLVESCAPPSSGTELIIEPPLERRGTPRNLLPTQWGAAAQALLPIVCQVIRDQLPWLLTTLRKLAGLDAIRHIIQVREAGHYKKLHRTWHMEHGNIAVGNWNLAFTATMLAPELALYFNSDESYGSYVEAWLAVLHANGSEHLANMASTFEHAAVSVHAMMMPLDQVPELRMLLNWRLGQSHNLEVLEQLAHLHTPSMTSPSASLAGEDVLCLLQEAATVTELTTCSGSSHVGDADESEAAGRPSATFSRTNDAMMAVAPGFSSGTHEPPSYSTAPVPGRSLEAPAQSMDYEDAEVEALLTATLTDMAATHSEDQIELQWLIESYLLGSQLGNPAEQWRNLVLSGNIEHAMTPESGQSAQVQPSVTVQPSCPEPVMVYEVSTPTSCRCGQAFDIFTPPGSDSDSEKDGVPTRPAPVQYVLIPSTPCPMPRPPSRGLAACARPSCCAEASCTSYTAWLESQAGHVGRTRRPTTMQNGSCLSPSSVPRSCWRSPVNYQAACNSLTWGSRYKRPRTRQPYLRRANKRRRPAMRPKEARTTRDVAKHAPCLSWNFIWSHFCVTVIHICRLSLHCLGQVIGKTNEHFHEPPNKRINTRHATQPKHELNHTHNPVPSRTGPKSGGGVPTSMRNFLVLSLLGSAKGTLVTPEVRVGAITNVAPEASRLENHRVRNGGEVVGQAINRIACPYTWSAKRAFRRARARAAANGTTMYRGRIHNMSSLQILNSQDSLPSHRPPRAAHHARTRRTGCRLRCLTWNISGASSAAYQELTCWLSSHQSEWDVVLVQETHWKGDTSCYASGPWHIVSTGTSKGDTSSGVAVFVHSRLAATDSISYRVHAQGRVLQVRIHGPTNAIDVLCVYQYVWRSTCNTEQNLQNRQKIWSAIRQALAAVPVRNDLVMGGDYNTSINQLHPHTGTSILRHASDSPDQDEFLSILQDFGLTLLNTWYAKNKVTCHNSGSYSQLDYLACRIQRADVQAKHCQPLTECVLGVWKENHHKPVGASILRIQPWTLPPKRPVTTHCQTVQKAIVAKTDAAIAMKEHVASELHAMAKHMDLQQLHDALDSLLTQAVSSFFPSHNHKKDERISADPLFVQPVKQMWSMYRAFRSSRDASLAGCLVAWRRYAQFRRPSRQVKQAAKQIRKQKILETEAKLQSAAGRGDQREVYQQVKKLAPWKPREAVRIRGDQGEMLAPAQQLQAIMAHCQAKFCRASDQEPMHELDQDFRIHEADVRKAIQSLPYFKAVPKHVPLAAVWRLCSEEIAPLFAEALRNTWRAGTLGVIPQAWRDAWLIWLTKPNKPSFRPEGLRPIGLTHPLSKVACTILRQHIKPALSEALRTRPQYAYTEGRGTLDALLRVHGFLRKARLLSLAQKQNVHARHAGMKPSRCSGGICLSLDLESAFDAVPRPALANSLRRLGVAEDIVQLIMQFHYGSCYHSSVASHEQMVGTTCGIKQGCKIAPYLFIALTIHVMDELARSISWEWLQRLFTFYADDAFASWLVQEPEQLRQAIQDIQIIIDIFNRLGMTVNVKKSAILYDLKGPDVKKILKHHQVKQQGGMSLQVRQLGTVALIPIVKQHDYLGTVIAFRDPATLTLNKRMLKARGQYSMLRKTINSPRIVSKKCRYRIWEAGVLSSSTYGLLASGLTTTGCSRLRQMASRQVRAIARLPAHLTHVSNVQVRAQLGAPDVIQMLHDAGGRRLAQLHDINAQDPQDIRGHEIAVEQLRHVLTTYKLDTDASQHLSQPAVEDFQIKCDICGQGFSTFNNMRKHKTRVHKVDDRRKIGFDPAEHAIEGLPQCRFCRHKFDTWHALRAHITQDRCTQTPWMQARYPVIVQQSEGLATASLPQHTGHPGNPTVAEPEQPAEPPPEQKYPILRNARVKTQLATQGWRFLLTSEHQQHLRQHCVICARWIVDPTALKRHLKQAHKEVWNQVASELQSQCATVKDDLIRDGVCPYCDRTSYSRHFHQCNVIFQSAIVHLYHRSSHDGSRDSHLDVPAPSSRASVSGPEGANNASPTRQGPQEAPQDAERQPPKPSKQRGRSTADNLPSNGDGAAARGCAQPGKVKHQHDLFPSTTRPGLSFAAALQGEPRMAEESQRGSGRRGSPHHHPECPHPGNSGKTDDARGQPTGSGKRQASRPPHKRQQDAVSEVECCRQEIGSGRHDPPADAGGGSQHAHGDKGAHPAGHSDAVPRIKATPAGTTRSRSRCVHPGASTSQRGSRSHAQQTQVPVQSLSLGPSLRAAQRTNPAAPRLGGGAAESNEQRIRPGSVAENILRCHLENRGNTCYLNANASIISICWQLKMANCEEALPSAWKHQLSTHKWNPRHFFRLHLMAWRQPEAQHDVAEFLTYMLPKFNWFPTFLSWSARLWVDHQIQCEAHSGVNVLQLSAPDGLISSCLQDTVRAWHQQHQLHALDSAPRVLVLQLPRFRQNSQGQYVKHGIPVNLHNPINIPVFRNAQTIDCEWRSYIVCAALVHLGQAMNAGHYRAALIQSGHAGDVIWYTDDNRGAASVELTDVGTRDEISANCYVLYCLSTAV